MVLLFFVAAQEKYMEILEISILYHYNKGIQKFCSTAKKEKYYAMVYRITK